MHIFTILICYAVYYSGIFHLYYYTFGKKTAQILVYHGLENFSGERLGLEVNWIMLKANFQKQIAIIKKYFSIVPLDVFHKSNRPYKLAVTFDDGYRDNYSIAYPILKQNKVPATIFITTGMIDTPQTTWPDFVVTLFAKTKLPGAALSFLNHTLDLSDKKAKELACSKTLRFLKSCPPHLRTKFIDEIKTALELDPFFKTIKPIMLTWGEIISMNQIGITYGAHTHTHPVLSYTTNEELQNELTLSKQLIETKIKKPILHFAYPNGHTEDFGVREINALKSNGFLYAYMNFFPAKNENNPYIIPRRPMDNSISQGLFGHFSKAVLLVQISGLGDILFRRHSRIFSKEKRLSTLLQEAKSAI